MDFEDYGGIINSLSSESISTKLEALQKLLNSQFIDITQNSWELLADKLEHLLLARDESVFILCLKVYFKVICNPVTSGDGYLSVLNGLTLVTNTRHFLSMNHIDSSNIIQIHVTKILKIVLKTQKTFLRYYIQTKQKVAENVADNFVSLINCSYKSNSILLDILCVLDNKALWFSNFFHYALFRNIFLKKLASCVSYAVEIFLNKLDEFSVDKCKNTSKNGLNFCQFSHSLYFLTELLKYKRGRSFFPIRSQTVVDNVNINKLIILCISKINTQLNDNIQKLLVEFVKNCTSNILNHEILTALLEPLNIQNIDKTHAYKSLETHRYVFEILNNFRKNPDILFGILERNKKNTSNSLNVTQFVVNLTIFCIRQFISRSESEHLMKEIIIDLLSCCKNLYKFHPWSLKICNPNKLIMAVKDLYDTLENYNVNLHYKLDMINILCYFFENFDGTNKIMNRNNFLTDIINFKLMNEHLNASNLSLIITIGNCDEMDELLKNNHNFLIKQYLDQTWYVQEHELGFIEDINLEKITVNNLPFLYVLFAISVNFNVIKALLSYENEQTLIENDSKPTTLSELIENCELCDPSESYIGLIVSKILISNIDVMVHLLKNFNLTDQLNILQTSSPIIIDSVSSLRHNLLLSIKYVGFVDGSLNDKILGQTQLSIGLPNFGIRHEKTQNELQKFLLSTRSALHDNGWFLQARRAFRRSCAEPYKISILLDLIKYSQKTRQNNLVWSEYQGISVFEEDYIAVSTIVRFGVLSGYLHTSNQCESNLISVIQQARALLKSNVKQFIRFDWFIGIIFIIASGNVEKAKAVLMLLTKSNAGPLIWYTFGCQYDPGIISKFYECLEIILKENCNLHTATNRMGFYPRNLAQKWLKQSLFDILPFHEICNFIIICILYPIEYALFFIIAMFKHKEQDIYMAAQECNFENVFKMSQMPDFCTSTYISFMDNLAKKYKGILQN